MAPSGWLAIVQYPLDTHFTVVHPSSLKPQVFFAPPWHTPARQTSPTVQKS
jgi:hypothetical protein